MRRLRDNILRIMTAVDMLASAILLFVYALTGNTLLMTLYYVSNFVLLAIVVIYSIDLSDKRERIERTKKNIRKIEEDEK